MTLDPFTLLAQLFNFALLLVLLRIFLYRPLLAVMAEREALATSELDEARLLRSEAASEREALIGERAREKSEHGARVSALAEQLEKLRSERLEAVERETQALRQATLDSLERDVDRALTRLRKNVADIVLAEVAHTLEWLANVDLHEQAVKTFLRRLEDLPVEQRRELAAESASGDVRITTARAVDPAARAEIASVVSEHLGASELLFEVDEDLLVGVVLDAGDLRLDGSAATRLETLSERFTQALAGQEHVDWEKS